MRSRPGMLPVVLGTAFKFTCYVSGSIVVMSCVSCLHMTKPPTGSAFRSLC